jgi:hypothetical protein
METKWVLILPVGCISIDIKVVVIILGFCYYNSNWGGKIHTCPQPHKTFKKSQLITIATKIGFVFKMIN